MSGLIEITCDNCSRTLKVPKNRAGQSGKCAHCNESVYIPFEDEIEEEPQVIENTAPRPNFQQKQQKRREEYSIPKAPSSASYKPPKYKKKKSSAPVIVLCIFIFALGNTTGYLFSEHIDRLLGTTSINNNESSIIHIPQKTSTPKIEPKDTEEVIELTPTNEDNSAVKLQVKSLLSQTTAKLDELESLLSTFDGNISSLSRKYKINVSEKTHSLLEEGNLDLKKGRVLCKSIQETLQQDRDLQDAKMKLQNVIASQEKTYVKINSENNALQKQLNKYQKTSSAKKQKISSKYMGKWYIKLLKRVKKIETIYNSVNITTHSASTKYRAIQYEIKRIKAYGRDVKKVTRTLTAKIKQGKDPHSWIESRRQTARSIPQKKQADLLENFLSNKKKLDIDIKSEYQNLLKATKDIHTQNNLLLETTLRTILRALQAVNRKWEEEYQTFDSAVSNFSIKEE